VHIYQHLSAVQTVVQRHAPRQWLAANNAQASLYLQYSTEELLQVIAQERQQNPALDSAEDALVDPALECPHCPPFGFCHICAPWRPDLSLCGESRTEAVLGDFAFARDDGGDDPPGERAYGLDESTSRTEWGLSARSPLSNSSDFDPLSCVPAPLRMADMLLRQLHVIAVNSVEKVVAQYLVDHLDERGYLRMDVAEASTILGVSEELIAAGIAQLQECEPPGVGARDLRECLLLQIQALRTDSESDSNGVADTGKVTAIAEALIRDHWDALVHQRYASLAKRLGVSVALVESGMSVVRERLTPHPLAQMRASWDYCPNTLSRTVRPDVLIRRYPLAFEVEAVAAAPGLHVNPQYRRMYQDLCASRTTSRAARPRMRISGRREPRLRLLPDDEAHVIALVEGADLLLKYLQQRQGTLRAVSEAIVARQQGYLETGQRAFLRPMTRQVLARDLGLHVSTVSRALMDKYVQLPSQEVVSFDVFFETAVSAKDLIAELIAGEVLHSPLTDGAIMDALAQRGICIARRTVVKYREELRLPASHMRRLSFDARAA
jgi:RNA polymerase sigma-54 factor